MEETLKNIRYRVTQARKIIGALNGMWWSKNTTRNRKKIIYNSMVKSVLIYGAEIWSLYEDDRRRINAAEMDALTLRRLMSYIYMENPFLMFLGHTQRRSTVGRTPLDE